MNRPVGWERLVGSIARSRAKGDGNTWAYFFAPLLPFFLSDFNIAG